MGKAKSGSKLRRTSKDASYYKAQFARTTSNKFHRAARIARRKASNPQLVERSSRATRRANKQRPPRNAAGPLPVERTIKLSGIMVEVPHDGETLV